MNNARKECPLDSLELELLPAMSNIPGKSCISLLFLFTNSRHKLKTTQSFQTRYWTGAARLNTFIAVTAMLHYHLLQHKLHIYTADTWGWGWITLLKLLHVQHFAQNSLHCVTGAVSTHDVMYTGFYF